MPPPDDLARRQALLMKALDGEAPPPIGFDPSALEAMSQTLRLKRMRAARRAWPELARCLGQDFAALFAAHVAGTPLASDRAPFLDGLRLFTALRGTPRLDDRARLEGLGAQLRLRSLGAIRLTSGVAFALRLGAQTWTWRLPLLGLQTPFMPSRVAAPGCQPLRSR